MRKQLLSVTVIAALSGCSIIQPEILHNNTVDVIHQTESNLSAQIDRLSSQILTQQTQINDLSAQLVTLHSQFEPADKKEAIASVNSVPASPAAPVASTALNAPAILGGVEKIKINAIDGEFNARVDTGAATSSLNAINMQEFERNGTNWVRFHLDEDKQNQQPSNTEKPWIEAPVLRYAKIRQSTTEKAERRPVIELWIHVGELHEKTQFTLADRTQMTHPVLLGREFLQDIAVVDVSKNYLQSK